MESQEKRTSILYAITSPLGFFALSLLIVEGFLTNVLIFSNLGVDSKYTGMLIGAVLFVVVVVGVLLLVCFKPENLTFSEGSHLKWLEMKKMWGTSEKPEKKSEAELGTLTSPNPNPDPTPQT